MLIAANVMVAVILLGAASAYGYVQWRLGQIKRINVGHLSAQGSSSQSRGPAANMAPFTVLVIGSDTRNLGSGASAKFGNTQSVQGQRSDSIILVRVVPQARKLALFSIPRDTLVDVPGYGRTRINAAFNSGTPTLLVQVLQQDFGIQVNHVAEFNFDTFRQIADAIGGVYVWFPTPAKDTFSNLGVPAGCVLLKGNTALAFARSREYQYYLNGAWHYQLYPESDLGRIQRQQAFAKLAAKKALQVAPTNPVTLNNVIAGITKNLTLDKSFSNSLIFELAQDFHHASLNNVPSYTYPTVNSTSVPGALDPQVAQGKQMIQEWLSIGTPPPAKQSSTTASSPPTTTINPSSVSVEVTNGSGVTGQAGKAAGQLHAVGYNATVNAAGNFGHTGNVIDYAPDAQASAKQLQAQLVGGATLKEDSALTPTPYNLELITGKDYNGIKAGVSPTSAASSNTSAPTTVAPASPAYDGTTTVDPASSSYYKGQYVPPGRVPGQIPQSCPN